MVDICPHCGERTHVEEKTNAEGDIVERIICDTGHFKSDWVVKQTGQ